MPRIIYPDATEISDLSEIQQILNTIDVKLQHWPLPTDETSRNLLAKPALDDEEKDRLLEATDHRFEQLKQTQGYTTRDLIVLHENIPGLDDILAKFVDIHYHTDDEVRYIIAGKGYFGFVDPEDKQYMLEVVAGDYINVPANAEHWFTLGDSQRIKAVRYFIDTEGWTPVYTQRPPQFTPENLPWAGESSPV